MRRPIVSKSERSGTGVDMANLSKAVCHGESDKCRFGNPPQESNSQRLGISRHKPDGGPSDPSLPPDDGICKSEPCLECRHAPTAGNIGTPRAGSPEIAFIKRHLSYGSCWN